MPADAYRNSPAYGAYEIAMMKHTLELEAQMGVKLGGVLTWAFTFPGTPYFAGYRALATNGINLPVHGRVQAARAPGRDARAPDQQRGAPAGRRSREQRARRSRRSTAWRRWTATRVQVLVWNYHDDLVTVAATPVHLTVKVPASFGSSVRVSHLRVDESHGDAYTVWVSQGMPASPSAAQIAALQAGDGSVVAGPGHEPSRWRRTARSASTSTLPRFGVSLVTLAPADRLTILTPIAPAPSLCVTRSASSRANHTRVACD